MTLIRRADLRPPRALRPGAGRLRPGPDADATATVLEQRLAAALKPPVTEVASFRRVGSGPLPAAADGKARRIVYYNAGAEAEPGRRLRVLERPQRHAPSRPSWAPPRRGSPASSRAATRRRRAARSRQRHVRRRGRDLAAVPWVAPEVGQGSPENNTGPPSEAKRLLDAVQALLTGGGGDRALRSTIVAEELAKAYGWMQLRVDRLDRGVRRRRGPGRRRVCQRCRPSSPASSAGTACRPRAVATAGSIENARLVAQKLADVGLIQSDVAAPGGGRGGAVRHRRRHGRAAGAWQPVPGGDPDRDGQGLADRDRRRPQGQARRARAARAPARARTPKRCWPPAAWPPADLAAMQGGGAGRGPTAARRRRGRRGDHDPGRTRPRLQEAAAATGIKLLSLGTQERAILAGGHPDLVPVTLPPNTYPGQTETVETVAVTALLVGSADLSDATVEALLTEVYGGIDFVQAGSPAGSLISRSNAQQGVTLRWHPAAERFLLRPAATQ